jgi:NTE family protein
MSAARFLVSMSARNDDGRGHLGETREKIMTTKKTISLVLGSGGARGLAHIGVIQVLEEQGYAIRAISGSSIGALVGGIYAAGEIDTFSDWLCALDRLDVIRLLDFSFSGAALFKGERIIETLRELVGERNIEDLPVDFTAVASDLDANKEVWLSSGPLFDAIRASIAFPTLIAGVNYRGRYLVDGGMLNPVPVAPTMRDLTDATLAVSLNGKRGTLPVLNDPLEQDGELHPYHRKLIDLIDSLPWNNGQQHDGESGFFDIISKSIDAMQTTIANYKIAGYPPDVLIELPKDICSIYEFDRTKEMIEIGRNATEAILDDLEAFFK